MQHSGFVHLHLHTQYSLLDGAIRPEALVEQFRRVGTAHQKILTQPCKWWAVPTLPTDREQGKKTGDLGTKKLADMLD